MNKQEFDNHWLKYIPDNMQELYKDELSFVITEAIAEYEAAQWLLYPENEPDLNTEYWVHDVWGSYYHSMGYNFDKNRVIAFLPTKKYPSFKGKEERK